MPSTIKVEVFSSNNESSHQAGGYKQSYLNNSIRVIQLPGVSDLVYPPQKKSFSMIKFMHDFYLDKYEEVYTNKPNCRIAAYLPLALLVTDRQRARQFQSKPKLTVPPLYVAH